MQKQEHFVLEGHRSTFWVKNIKVPFGIGHPLTYRSNLVYMCAGGFRGPKSSNRIELSIHSRVIVILLIWVSLALGGACMRHPHTPTLTSIPIHHPSRGTPGIGQNSIALEVIKIFQFFLKI